MFCCVLNSLKLSILVKIDSRILNCGLTSFSENLNYG